MFNYKKWRRRKKESREILPDHCGAVQEDSLTLSLPMLDITLTRKLNIDVPHEVSVIVPRSEIRCRDGSAEWIYSSITVVHAPRHPLAGEQTPGADTIGSGGTSLPSPEEGPEETAEIPPPKIGAAGELSTPGKKKEPSIKVSYRGR